MLREPAGEFRVRRVDRRSQDALAPAQRVVEQGQASVNLCGDDRVQGACRNPNKALTLPSPQIDLTLKAVGLNEEGIATTCGVLA